MFYRTLSVSDLLARVTAEYATVRKVLRRGGDKRPAKFTVLAVPGSIHTVPGLYSDNSIPNLARACRTTSVPIYREFLW